MPVLCRSGASEDILFQMIGVMSNTYDLLDRKTSPTSVIDENVDQVRINGFMDPVMSVVERHAPVVRTEQVSKRVAHVDTARMSMFMEDQDVVGSFSTYPSSVGDYSAVFPRDNDIPITPQLANTTETFNYAPAMFASAWVRLLRYLQPVLKIASLKERIASAFHTRLAAHLRELGCALEVEYLEDHDYDEQLKPTSAPRSLRGFSVARDMLQAGELLISIILMHWNLEFSVVGESIPFTYQIDTSEGLVNATDNIYSKQYLMPVVFNMESSGVLRGIPYPLRVDVEAKKDILTSRNASELKRLIGPILLCHAVRIAAGENFRSLITYVSSVGDWPKYRDDTFRMMLTDIVYSWLQAADYGMDQSGNGLVSEEVPFVASLVSMAGLEEAMGVSEPTRLSQVACMYALQRFGFFRIEQCLDAMHDDDAKEFADGSIAAVSHRVSRVVSAVEQSTKMGTDVGLLVRLGAFQHVVRGYLESQADLAWNFGDKADDDDAEDEGGPLRFDILPLSADNQLSKLERGLVPVDRLMKTFENLASCLSLPHEKTTETIAHCIENSCALVYSRLLLSSVQDMDPDLVVFQSARCQRVTELGQSMVSALGRIDQQVGTDRVGDINRHLVVMTAAAMESILEAAKEVYAVDRDPNKVDALLSKAANFSSAANVKRLFFSMIVPALPSPRGPSNLADRFGKPRVTEQSMEIEQFCHRLFTKALVKLMVSTAVDEKYAPARPSTSMIRFLEGVVQRHRTGTMRASQTFLGLG
jgi:hypothetical protein